MIQYTTKNKNKIIEDKNKLQVALSCVILLFLWEIIAIKIDNDIYLPTLGQVLISIKEIVFTDRFIIDVISTLGRCIISFITALGVAFILGIISYSRSWFKNFLTPITTLASAIPNMVLIVLALIWFNKESAPYIVVFIMVFPVLYDCILGSMNSIDKGILEMANLYKIGTKNKIMKIYLPAIRFSLISILSSTISLGFKIVIAGEVYGQPLYGIGAMIQSEKVNFNTTAIFAWIIIIVVISFLLNQIEKFLVRRSFIWKR
ncbi:MAG: ABC transporter permease subunit [Terrisporobacter sp.]|uniref:ABC transporter permease n=1 Tax=Terrisporobacter sp. TaxID=1965305 RepID=UPI002FC8C801